MCLGVLFRWLSGKRGSHNAGAGCSLPSVALRLRTAPAGPCFLQLSPGPATSGCLHPKDPEARAKVEGTAIGKRYPLSGVEHLAVSWLRELGSVQGALCQRCGPRTYSLTTGFVNSLFFCPTTSLLPSLTHNVRVGGCVPSIQHLLHRGHLLGYGNSRLRALLR